MEVINSPTMAVTLAVANHILALLPAALVMEAILYGLGDAHGAPLEAAVRQLLSDSCRKWGF